MRVAQAEVPSFGWVWSAPPQPIASWEYWQSVFGWATSNLNTILLSTIILLLLIEMLVYWRRRRADRWGKKMQEMFDKLATMSDKDRREYLKTFYEDSIVTFTENLVLMGTITREQAREAYLDEAYRSGVKGLIPKTSLRGLKKLLVEKHDPEKVEALRNSRKHGAAKTAMGSVFLKAINKPAT